MKNSRIADNKVVFMYHDVVKDDDCSSGFQNESAFQYKVNEKTFEEQVKALSGRDVAFTFDDGGVSFLTMAAPILEKFGLRGVFFVSTKYIGTPGFLTKEQVLELHQRGHVIGSHSHSHPSDLSKKTKVEIEKEWEESVKILSGIIGQAVTTASIPNGNGSKSVVECARKAGISELYTSEPTTRVQLDNGLSLCGRYVVHNDTTAEEIIRIVSDKKYRRNKHRKWLVIGIVKGLLGSFYKPMKRMIVKQ